MEIAHIDEIKNEVGNGCTEPIFCSLHDGRDVIFKSYNNPEGRKILVNELICLRLAQKLNLPVPDGGLARIDDTSSVSCLLSNTQDLRGVGFYSVRLNNVTPGLYDMPREFIQKYCVNSQDFIPIILFDHLVYNNDRNNGNALFDFKSKKLYIIDNSHCFYLGSIWDSIQLERCITEEDFRHNKILANNKYFYNNLVGICDLDRNILYEKANLFKSLIKDDFLDEIFCEIPTEWGIGTNDLETLKKYIKYRLNSLIQMCDVICNDWEVI